MAIIWLTMRELPADVATLCLKGAIEFAYVGLTVFTLPYTPDLNVHDLLQAKEVRLGIIC